MDHRRLGRSGLHVSSLCLGTMMFGDQTTEREAVERAVRRLPLPVRTWDPTDRALPQPLPS